MIALAALTVTLALMLLELRISLRHDRALRQRGALAPADAAYSTMRWAYPVVFMGMASEGALSGPPGPGVFVAGLALFVGAKLLKAWAIWSLGERWTYRVFVLPNTPLVTTGPYRWIRHPNYLAVVAEIVGFSLMTHARLTGILALLFFGELLRRRIRAEEEALGLSR